MPLLIRRLKIKNFRGIRDIEVELDETTVFIGPNSAGKSSILDAVRLALGRRWGSRGTGFTQYDFTVSGATKDPPFEIEIELDFWEDAVGEWPEGLTQDLTEILQSNPETGVSEISLRVTCKWEEVTKSLDAGWSFLGRDRRPIAGKAARAANLNRFFNYAPVFSLSALRDSASEFAPRSQFWGNLLRAIEVPPKDEAELEKRVEELNKELLASGPKLESVRATLAKLSAVIAGGAADAVDIRALPLRLWDLVSRAEVVVRGAGAEPWLPLSRHGHGVQSLAVIYVFQAFVEQALGDTYEKESSPILSLEEPEAHLHPQAARALLASIEMLPGQKLVATHSPYFMENVPLRKVRVVRRVDGHTKVAYLPTRFFACLPNNADLEKLLGAWKGSNKFSFDQQRSELSVEGILEERQARDLMMCFTGPDAREHHRVIRDLQKRSQSFISNKELLGLQTCARRMRGEIFFARAWLLCEGQSEYLILHALAEATGWQLDQQGISVIDYKNNGSCGSFAALARALEYPWVVVCDGDDGGKAHVSELRGQFFTEDEIKRRVLQLPVEDLEECIVQSGWRSYAVALFLDLGDTPSDEALLEKLRDQKTSYAARLAEVIRTSGEESVNQAPKPLVEVIDALKREAK